MGGRRSGWLVLVGLVSLCTAGLGVAKHQEQQRQLNRARAEVVKARYQVELVEQTKERWLADIQQIKNQMTEAVDKYRTREAVLLVYAQSLRKLGSDFSRDRWLEKLGRPMVDARQQLANALQRLAELEPTVVNIEVAARADAELATWQTEVKNPQSSKEPERGGPPSRG